MFRLQREAARQEDLWQKGREYAGQALDILLKLQEYLPYAVGWSRGKDRERDKRCDAELEQLERVVMLLTDRTVRHNMELAYAALKEADDICQWGNLNLSPQQVVYISSQYAVEGISAYLRGEGSSGELPENMKQIKTGYEATQEEKAFQWEMQEQEMERMRREAQARRQRPEEAEEDSDGPTET